MTLLKVLFGNVPSSSEFGKLNLIDLFKIVRTALLVGLATIIVYIIENNANYDLGFFEPLFIVFLTSVLELIQRTVKNNDNKNSQDN